MKKKLLIMTLILSLLMSTLSIAYAYTLNSHYFSNTYVTYTWGSNLQSPSNFIRQGGEGAITHLNAVQTHLDFGYNS